MSTARIDAIGGTLITTDPAAKMILRHMNEQRAVDSRSVRAGDGRSRNVVIRDQFIIEDLDETHLLIKTDLLEEVKAEFQAQVRVLLPHPSPYHTFSRSPLLTLPSPSAIATTCTHPPAVQLEEFTFKAQIEAESGNAKPKQR